MPDAIADANERAVAAQKAISHMVNSMANDPVDFIKLMNRDHRTLQQSFTRLCLAWLANCASPDYGTDPRNEYSQHIAKKLLAKVEPYELNCPYM